MSLPPPPVREPGISSEQAPCRDIVVGVADAKLSNQPGTSLVTYALGSCLGITFYDPQKRIGGLLHAMLPDSALHRGQKIKVAMFLDTGIQELLAALQQNGSLPRSLEVKVFGGAQVISADRFFNIGARNVKSFREISQRLGLHIFSAETGGQVNRTIKLFIDSGKVSVRTPNQPLFWR